MKTFRWKGLGFILAIVAVLAGNLIGISALAADINDPTKMTGPDGLPAGLLVGYTPTVEKIKTGEHLEYFGWPGALFGYSVSDYDYLLCCKRTYRAMDGCMNLQICPAK